MLLTVTFVEIHVLITNQITGNRSNQVLISQTNENIEPVSQTKIYFQMHFNLLAQRHYNDKLLWGLFGMPDRSNISEISKEWGQKLYATAGCGMG